MEEKEKIDVNGENEIIQDKIKAFCSVLGEMPFFPKFVIVSEEKKLELVESEIIKNLFSDLEGKNKFTDDQDVYEATYTANLIKLTRSFDEYQSKFEEMKNHKFLKKFIKKMINLNESYRAMLAWKPISSIFLAFVVIMSGIGGLISGILAGSKLSCFLGFLVMCAWAGLICSLVFHLSLALLIPSAIILGLLTICVLANIVKLQVLIYKVRQKKGTYIDDFFNLVGEINQYLDPHDLPPEKISSGEKIPRESSIDEKIKDVNTKKDDEEKSNIKIEGNKEDEKK